MANFLVADSITAKTEAGYNSGNGEAETAMGIDRGANPHWNGWVIVDGYKPCTAAEMNHALLGNANFMPLVHSFFKANYWDALKLDFVSNQQVADNLFDCSINQGSGIAARFMQQASGVKFDGVIGPQTLNAINNGNDEAIYNTINQLRRERYEVSAVAHPEWLNSWLGRLTPYQTT